MATDTVLFLCPHNAAKSVLAAEELRRLARARGLSLVADSAGTEPSEAVAPAVAAWLDADGIDVRGYRPRRVTAPELEGALRVVSIGCPPEELAGASSLERWDDVPPASEGVAACATAIRAHVSDLLDRLDRRWGALP